MNNNKIKFHYVFAKAGRIIYWILIAALSFIIWSMIVDVTDGFTTVLLSCVAGMIIGMFSGNLWIYLYED